ncbi:unnamed protein product [Bursaphelenchus xylophilus]|nr:unnamed protein product [Bursaphelenchus xylophilus]CAG9126019.1 unnamed protein product [Bursaphelenchus xylophilus]
MLKFAALLFLIVLANATPTESNGNASRVTLIRGVDFTAAVNTTHSACFKRWGYGMAFVRIYNGQPDEVGFKNLLAVYDDLSVQLVIVPELDGLKTPKTQVSEVLSVAKKKGWGIRGLWLQITSPLSWSKITAKNVQFIQEFAKEAAANKVAVSFYTNWYDYKVITGNSRALSAPTLWYWNVLGTGEAAQTPANLEDFRPFGTFQKALVKQYGQTKNVCEVLVNQNVYEHVRLSDQNSDEILSSVSRIVI